MGNRAREREGEYQRDVSNWRVRNIQEINQRKGRWEPAQHRLSEYILGMLRAHLHSSHRPALASQCGMARAGAEVMPEGSHCIHDGDQSILLLRQKEGSCYGDQRWDFGTF